MERQTKLTDFEEFKDWKKEMILNKKVPVEIKDDNWLQMPLDNFKEVIL